MNAQQLSEYQATKQLRLAQRIAYKAHEGQVDKGGHPYFGHLEAVASQVRTTEQKTAAYLHDILEDTEVTLEDLRNEGFSKRILDAVKLLTRDKNDGYMQYIRRIRDEDKTGVATAVKKADLRNNMDLSRIPNPTEKDYSRVEKYEKALKVLNDTSVLRERERLHIRERER